MVSVLSAELRFLTQVSISSLAGQILPSQGRQQTE